MTKKTKTIRKLIDITPHRSIMLKIGQTGYCAQEALAELIDNAIDAKLPKKKLTVTVDITSDIIVISDTGKGMNEQEASRAIRLGFSSKRGKLGEFGLGLKTATSSLGKSFTLITTPWHSGEEYVLEYDEQHWLKGGSWHKYPFIVRRGVKSQKSGTTVIIKNLKIEFSNSFLHTIKDEFGLRYGPFIKNLELELIINGDKAVPLEPNLLEGKKRIDLNYKGGKVHGWWGYQLSGLNKAYYGFHTFRRGRLVTTFDKIGLKPNQEVKQIIGELNIENVPIAHDKRGWIKETVSYKSLERKLQEYFHPYDKKAKRLLSGLPASSGIVAGTARRINMFMSADMEKEVRKLEHGDIIVTEMTRPQFLLGIRRSGGIITDQGGKLCHAAIVAREFNIPAIVGTQIATKILRDGQKVILDGSEGHVYEY